MIKKEVVTDRGYYYEHIPCAEIPILPEARLPKAPAPITGAKPPVIAPVNAAIPILLKLELPPDVPSSFITPNAPPTKAPTTTAGTA
jgi:hypothetical protein